MAKITLPVVVTPSRVELGLRCYRRHVLNDLLQRARYKSGSLEFGSLIHAAVAEWWRSNDENKAVSVAEQEWDKRFEQTGLTARDLTLELAMSMVERYVDEAVLQGPFAQEPGDWQMVTVEDRLEIPMVGGGRLSFQTDRVVYNNTNAHLVIVDSKTAGRLDKRWERQWETSLQMKLYKAGSAKAYDFPVEAVDVVVEGILKDVPSQVRYIPCPDWSPDVLTEAVDQARAIAARDHAFIMQGTLPQLEEFAVNRTELNYMSCFEYGVECPFRRLCTAEPDERVAILRAEYFEIPEEDSGY